jgi:metal-responsive CopG/Arc/MetJ family transcriptional regulator
MKVKASITLSEEVLREVDTIAKGSSRSEVIESALREFLLVRARAIRDARDIEIYDKHADEYNALMEGVFRDQIPIELDDDA